MLLRMLLKMALLLRECATDKEEDAGDEQAEEGAEDAAEDAAEDGAAAEEGGECMEPPMFSMDLILANEELDKSIAELYNQIIQSTNETERGEHLGMLTMLKDVREQIDDHISNLLEEEEPEKIEPRQPEGGGGQEGVHPRRLDQLHQQDQWGGSRSAEGEGELRHWCSC